MSMLPLHHRLLTRQSLPTMDVQKIIEAARSLRQADRSGVSQPLLRGKNIAVLCEDAHCECAEVFSQAATALGARVSLVRPDAAFADGQAATRLLGKLYDAVDCEDLQPEQALKLQRDIGVPVFNGIARPDHPVMADLARELHSEAGEEASDRRYLMQAVLVSAMA